MQLSKSKTSDKSDVKLLSKTSNIGGDERNRTADLLLARQALSHLSYIPDFARMKDEGGRMKFILLHHSSLIFHPLHSVPGGPT